jgi:methyl-accepting chemotaxis protein
MLQTLFSPGKRLMRQLRMPAKFSLIIVTLLIPLFMLAFLFLSKTNDDLAFVDNELIGVQMYQDLGPLATSIAAHRGQALQAFIGSPDPAAAAKAATGIDAALGSLNRALTTDDPFKLGPLLAQIETAWTAVKTSQPTQVDTITAQYGALYEAMAAYQAQVSEASSLSLDPDVASYYLMVAGTDRLPALISHLVPLRGLASYAAAKPEEIVATRLRLAAFAALVKVENKEAHAAIQRSAKARPDLTGNIDTTLFASIDQYLGVIQGLIVEEPAAAPASLFDQGSVVLGNVVKLRDASLQSLQAELDERKSALERHRSMMLIGVGSALAMAAYCLVSFFLSSQSGFKGIAKRVEKLGVGDLTQSSEAVGRDEISESINRFRAGVSSLALLVKGVRQSAESISEATAEIAAGNNDLAQRGARVAGTVQQTSENMNSLSAKVEENLKNANQAQQLTHSALAVASSGDVIVNQAIEKMAHITTSSKRIGDIIEVINGIAFQTNILALNAAVEAARAGEQGRGFAVVASEVRNLAQRSATAAKEIGDLIKSSIDNVEQGADFVNKAGTTMGEIVLSIQSVSDIVTEITNASHGQSAEIREMATAVSEVDASTQENAAMVEEIAAAVMALDERATFLSESVRSFQIDVDPAPAVATRLRLVKAVPAARKLLRA